MRTRLAVLLSRHSYRLALVWTAFLAGAVDAQTPATPDTDFGMGGQLVFSLYNAAAPDERVNDIIPLANGKLLVIGEKRGLNAYSSGTSINAVAARLNADGSLDTSFGHGGWIEVDHNAHIDRAVAATMLADGSVVIAAEMATDAYGDFAVMKISPTGQLDPTFGMAGGTGGRRGYNVVSIGGPDSWDQPSAMAVMPDGDIVVAGSPQLAASGSLRYRRAAVVRFTPNGEVDTTYGVDGVVALPAMGASQRDDIVTAIALGVDGRPAIDGSLTLVGHTQFGNNAFVVRLRPDGSIDPGFGENGVTRFSASQSSGVHRGVSHLHDARLLPGGYIALLGTGSDRGFTFLRLLPSGDLDTGFGLDGRITVKHSGITEYDVPAALAVQAGGSLVAAGHTATPNQFMLARVRQNGAPDLAFDAGSASRSYVLNGHSSQPHAVALFEDGRIVAGGFAEQSGRRFALLRLLGDPDSLFADGFE